MIFIRLENSYDAALGFLGSPQESPETSRFGGIQLLLGNSDYPYIQRTNAINGFELETYEVRVKSICGTVDQDITSFFEIVDTFQDPVTGFNQIEWQLKGLIYDFGFTLVYLEITRTGVSLNNKFFRKIRYFNSNSSPAPEL